MEGIFDQIAYFTSFAEKILLSDCDLYDRPPFWFRQKARLVANQSIGDDERTERDK
jgi:hypothetical protein